MVCQARCHTSRCRSRCTASRWAAWMLGSSAVNQAIAAAASAKGSGCVFGPGSSMSIEPEKGSRRRLPVAAVCRWKSSNRCRAASAVSGGRLASARPGGWSRRVGRWRGRPGRIPGFPELGRPRCSGPVGGRRSRRAVLRLPRVRRRGGLHPAGWRGGRGRRRREGCPGLPVPWASGRVALGGRCDMRVGRCGLRVVEAGAAGDQDRAGATVREERLHLCCVRRVVEDDEHAAVADRFAAQDECGRRVSELEPAPTPSAVRKARTAVSCPVGLPDGSSPRRFTNSWPCGAVEDRRQCGQFGRATDEGAGAGGELSRDESRGGAWMAGSVVRIRRCRARRVLR